MPKTKKIKVLFNDAHANLPKSTIIPTGGASRFAMLFLKYFKNNFPQTELISLLFSHNTENQNIYHKETTRPRRYFEIIYPRELLSQTYKKQFTKKEYLEYLSPWLGEVEKIFDKVKPDLVFLNGFNISNWLILEIAHRRNVPVCAQHAGIWKKEISMSNDAFSVSMRRILNLFEKDLAIKTSHQIFLNEYSRKEFFLEHNIEETPRSIGKTSIVPLPAEFTRASPLRLKNKKSYSIGMIARWDSIKNHSLILRFGTFIQENQLPFSIYVVTQWAKNSVSNFRDKYVKVVNIVKPMNHRDLTNFYSTKDIFILPSHFETCGGVVMEAILLGKPVIISDKVGMVSDYKKFHLNDVVINTRASGKEVASVVYNLINHKELYLKRFARLQQNIIKKHNPNVVFMQYNKIFNRTIK
jgi:glycosyltransferase involved in cell wall biosynthesis